MKFLILFISLIFGASLYASKINAKIQSITGTAFFIESGDIFAKPLSLNQVVSIGTVIKTKEGCTVILSIAPGVVIKILENSTINLKDLAYEEQNEKVVERKARIELSEGTIVNLLDHDTPEITDFRIETPDGSAAARGTFYAVVVKDGKTYVQVEEGRVGVRLSDIN